MAISYGIFVRTLFPMNIFFIAFCVSDWTLNSENGECKHTQARTVYKGQLLSSFFISNTRWPRVTKPYSVAEVAVLSIAVTMETKLSVIATVENTEFCHGLGHTRNEKNSHWRLEVFWDTVFSNSIVQQRIMVYGEMPYGLSRHREYSERLKRVRIYFIQISRSNKPQVYLISVLLWMFFQIMISDALALCTQHTTQYRLKCNEQKHMALLFLQSAQHEEKRLFSVSKRRERNADDVYETRKSLHFAENWQIYIIFHRNCLNF